MDVTKFVHKEELNLLMGYALYVVRLHVVPAISLFLSWDNADIVRERLARWELHQAHLNVNLHALWLLLK